ncbi:3-hydroxyacyl-CoA dehydrogenase family protein [Leucobacter celer]|uniref:3-hydroxyacyl-CoA dehydrogenase family protein n=1 Tax=Leucobacter celer TaxID=668625 RepID=UPI0006A794D1|nr:3-hydroxyacyl-CoA dehydrogenase family protein [Leucobacter celer]
MSSTEAQPVYAVVGSGYMGGGIAQVLALAGAEVHISDLDLATAERNRVRLIAEAEQFVADGLFPADAADLIEANLHADTLEGAVAHATFIAEAVPEKIEIKHATLRRIAAAAPADAIIGTNTSTILIRRLAEPVSNPERFLGVHFANPSPFIPGVEIITHAGTDPGVVARVREIVASIGKESAEVGDATGFVMNRLQYALFHEATQLVEEGVAGPEEIDTIVRTSFGFRLPFFGPFAIADMAGLDVYAFCYASLQTEFPERFATPAKLTELVASGKLGTKSGGGFLPIPAERTADLISYRNRAYVGLRKLIDELGPAPTA